MINVIINKSKCICTLTIMSQVLSNIYKITNHNDNNHNNKKASYEDNELDNYNKTRNYDKN